MGSLEDPSSSARDPAKFGTWVSLIRMFALPSQDPIRHGEGQALCRLGRAAHLIPWLGVGADHDGLTEGGIPGLLELQPQALGDESHSVPRNSQIRPCRRPEPKVWPAKLLRNGLMGSVAR